MREEWKCENPKCNAKFAEYVNGCPRCSTGEVGGSYSVRLRQIKPMTNITAKEIRLLTEKARSIVRLAELRFEVGSIDSKKYVDDVREAVSYLQEATNMSSKFSVEI